MVPSSAAVLGSPFGSRCLEYEEFTRLAQIILNCYLEYEEFTRIGNLLKL